ncbi:MAG: SsrA-binding protein SmpB [Dehalococcoidia bacterium]|nr:SsrA-binding protein SmpB [Dehalococcoidia bacterium]
MAKSKARRNGAKAESGKNAAGGDRLISDNRRARFDYDILESLEAGLVLTGTEIKSLRAGRVTLAHAFARISGGEVWLHGMHIPPYAQGNIYNHEPTRPRKLLLHRRQILALNQRVTSSGYTLIPLRLYITRHKAKVQLGLARGRKTFDKRQVIAKRDADLEMARALTPRH